MTHSNRFELRRSNGQGPHSIVDHLTDPTSPIVEVFDFNLGIRLVHELNEKPGYYTTERDANLGRVVA